MALDLDLDVDGDSLNFRRGDPARSGFSLIEMAIEKWRQQKTQKLVDSTTFVMVTFFECFDNFYKIE